MSGDSLEKALVILKSAPCGDSYIKVMGKTYYTDTAYAFEGIEILEEIAKKLESEEDDDW